MSMQIEQGLFPGHVLQRTPRGASAVVGGVCTASGEVTVTVRKGGKSVRGLNGVRAGNAAGGRFTATVAKLPPGGPYTVEFSCGGERAAVEDVLVGDLWLMAGQSNMQGVGNLAAAPKPHPLVHNFSMGRRWEIASDPLHYLPESPDRVHGGTPLAPELIAAAKKRRDLKGVGVGVYFGKLMLKRTGVPQGLIATAHGGTSMAQWDPALKDRGGDSLYGSMWLSLQAVGQPVAGVLWYQGCSDTNPAAAAVYTQKMQELVAAVRRDLGQSDLPWITVQIGRVVERRDDARGWNSVQEQQRLLPAVIPHLETVPAVDLDLDDLIHISAKAFPVLAERMASQAARLVHRDRGEKPPVGVKSVRFVERPAPEGATIEVAFSNAVGGLRAAGLPRGFSLVDGDQQPREMIYKTVLERDRARLYLTNGGVAGLRVMYGRGVNPVCNVSDGRGMAVPVFGPLPIPGMPVVSAWFLRWNMTPIEAGEDIAGLPRPALGGDGRVFADTSYLGFVNCHPEWERHGGHVGFSSFVDIPEDMDVEVRTGYDGPFRLWIDGREVHTDLGGINPALADARRIPLRLAKGRRSVEVLMALNNGQAWGFFLRLALPGLDAAEIGPDHPLPMPWA